MFRIVLASLTLLAAAAPAFPQARDESAAVQGAVLRFFDAMETGDADLLTRVVYAYPESPQQRARAYFAELVAAARSLERTFAARFPAEKRRLACGFDLLITQADRDAVRRSKVHVDDAHMARLEKNGETTSIRLRRIPGREWQVELAIVSSDQPPDDGAWMQRRPDSMSRIGLDRLQGMADAYDQVRQRIENNELATAAATEADLLERLKKIHQEAARRRAALPERRYWGGGGR